MTLESATILLLLITNTVTVLAWYLVSEKHAKQIRYIRRLTADAIKEQQKLEKQYQEVMRDFYVRDEK